MSRKYRGLVPLLGGALAMHAAVLTAQEAAPAPLSETAPAAASATAPAPIEPAPPVQRTLVAGTPVFVMLDEDLNTNTVKLGHRFAVVVLRDVIDAGTMVIPKGAVGEGQVTFVTGNGGFGKAGILGIALRHVMLGEQRLILDGRYREEGKSKGDETAATMFAVGIFSGFIRGKDVGIPRGRELKARTGEDFAFTVGAAPPPVPQTPVPQTPAPPQPVPAIPPAAVEGAPGNPNPNPAQNGE